MSTPDDTIPEGKAGDYSCADCGADVFEGDKVCRKCGATLEWDDAEARLASAGVEEPVVPFSSGHERAQRSIVLWGIFAATTVLSTVLSLFPFGSVEDNLIRQGIIGVLWLAAFVAAIVGFLMWVHRVYRNLLAFGARGLKYSAAKAIGYFFVPILNLFHPYEVIATIWKASDPELGSDQEWRKARLTQLVGWGWGAWLLAGSLAWISARTQSVDSSADAWASPGWLVITSDVLVIVSVIICIAIIRRIDQRQEKRIGQIGGQSVRGLVSPPMG